MGFKPEKKSKIRRILERTLHRFDINIDQKNIRCPLKYIESIVNKKYRGGIISNLKFRIGQGKKKNWGLLDGEIKV